MPIGCLVWPTHTTLVSDCSAPYSSRTLLLIGVSAPLSYQSHFYISSALGGTSCLCIVADSCNLRLCLSMQAPEHPCTGSRQPSTPCTDDIAAATSRARQVHIVRLFSLAAQHTQCLPEAEMQPQQSACLHTLAPAPKLCRVAAALRHQLFPAVAEVTIAVPLHADTYSNTPVRSGQWRLFHNVAAVAQASATSCCRLPHCQQYFTDKIHASCFSARD